MSITLKSADAAYNLLDGVFCIYKSIKTSYKHNAVLIKEALSQELNEMETRPAKKLIRIVGNVGVDKDFYIERTRSLADHPLVVGERYNEKNIALDFYQNLGTYVSGVNLVGIGKNGYGSIRKLKKANIVKEYEITGRLGMATISFCEKGKMIAESKYRFVTMHKINMLCEKIVAANSRYALKSIGFDINTQEAYEIFSKGNLKPPFKQSDPILYAMKCVEFKPPYFKLKVSSVNDYYLYFYHLINQIGLKLKTHACVSQIACTRIGKFTIDDCLSYKEIELQQVINNIAKNYDKVQEYLISQENSYALNNMQNTKITNNLNVDHKMIANRSPLKGC